MPATRRSRLARISATLARGIFPLADLHQRAHDAPAHFVKEAIALDDESQLWAGLFEIATREGSHIGFHLVTARAGEAAEIVFADE